MATLDYKEKMLGTKKENGSHQIVVTHLTIRQSIFFLHLRLVTIEILAALGLVIFLTIFFSPQVSQRLGENILVLNIPIFITMLTIKSFFTVYVIVSWLNQYYEIKPNEIVLKKGLIFKKEKRFLLIHLGSVEMEQGVFGRIFNFGTLKLFNWTSEKYEYLYLIHNPFKYQKILEELLPDADKSESVVRKHLIETDAESA